MIRYNELTKIDSLGSRPHKRHLAVVSRIKAPHRNGVVKLLDSQVAVTVCGRYVGWFTDASDTSLLFQNGEVYAVQCASCFGGAFPERGKE